MKYLHNDVSYEVILDVGRQYTCKKIGSWYVYMDINGPIPTRSELKKAERLMINTMLSNGLYYVKTFDGNYKLFTLVNGKFYDFLTNAEYKGEVGNCFKIRDDNKSITIDDAIQILETAKKVCGGKATLILSMMDSEVEDVMVKDLVIINEDGSSYVEVRA